MSPAARRNRAILAEAERLTRTPPQGPVIVAGVTGSIPATVELMRAVAGLPQGAIVLPGARPALDDESWAAIARASRASAVRPEEAARRLGIERARRAACCRARRSTPAAPRAQRSSPRRCARPARRRAGSSTSQRRPSGAVAARSHGVSLIEAPTAQDEAEVVALILREAAETPGRTAALVSPDRLLARRVAVRLEAWGIRVDDCAGRPFAKTPPGAFLDLVIAAAAEASRRAG